MWSQGDLGVSPDRETPIENSFGNLASPGCSQIEPTISTSKSIKTFRFFVHINKPLFEAVVFRFFEFMGCPRVENLGKEVSNVQNRVLEMFAKSCIRPKFMPNVLMLFFRALVFWGRFLARFSAVGGWGWCQWVGQAEGGGFASELCKVLAFVFSTHRYLWTRCSRSWGLRTLPPAHSLEKRVVWQMLLCVCWAALLGGLVSDVWILLFSAEMCGGTLAFRW